MKYPVLKAAAGLMMAAVLAFLCISCSQQKAEGESSSNSSSSAAATTAPTAAPTENPQVSASPSPTPPPSQSGTEEGQNSSQSAESSTPASTVKPTPKPTAEPVKTVRVTIPEGYTVAQIAQALEDNGVCSASEFVAVSQEYTPKSFSIPSDSNRAFKMEGYLFPDTYEFYVGDDPEDVLIKLLNNYNAKAGGLSSQQLIVASIVEKESRSAENAALVASVIYNRLNAGMKLEMDPTREYINQYVTASPYLSNTGKYAALYNTYKCQGLPAGPICNPGSRAIEAALHPASSEYLFFFFGNDNQNHYSKTFEEHQAAMEKYGVQYS